MAAISVMCRIEGLIFRQVLLEPLQLPLAELNCLLCAVQSLIVSRELPDVLFTYHNSLVQTSLTHWAFSSMCCLVDGMAPPLSVLRIIAGT